MHVNCHNLDAPTSFILFYIHLINFFYLFYCELLRNMNVVSLNFKCMSCTYFDVGE